MSIVEDTLKLLEDGEWHTLEEIENKTKLRDFEVKNVTKFLAQYDIIKLDKEGEKAKLDHPTQDFLRKIRQVEGEEGR